MNELKPCPFCGAPAHKWSWNGGTRIDCSAWDSSDKRTHYVGIGTKIEAEAIEAWNRRTQPDRKTGHWKKVSADRYTQSASYVYRCSECGETHVGETRFCPHCGVYMKGDE